MEEEKEGEGGGGYGRGRKVEGGKVGRWRDTFKEVEGVGG